MESLLKYIYDPQWWLTAVAGSIVLGVAGNAASALLSMTFRATARGSSSWLGRRAQERAQAVMEERHHLEMYLYEDADHVGWLIARVEGLRVRAEQATYWAGLFFLGTGLLAYAGWYLGAALAFALAAQAFRAGLRVKRRLEPIEQALLVAFNMPGAFFEMSEKEVDRVLEEHGMIRRARDPASILDD